MQVFLAREKAHDCWRAFSLTPRRCAALPRVLCEIPGKRYGLFRVYFHRARPGMLGLGQRPCQNTVAVVRLGLLSIDWRWERERLLILPGLEADPVHGRTLGGLHLRLPLQAQRVLLGRDLHIFRMYAGHRDLQRKALSGLV